MRVYLTKAMSGRYCDELVDEAIENLALAQKYELEVLDPVIIEKVARVHKRLHPKQTLKLLWERDKWLLREAHVLIDTTASMKSVGSEWEVGLMRYNYWKPVIRVYSGDTIPRISQYEADATCLCLDSAYLIAVDRWGTWWKRFKWRVRVIAVRIPKFILRQVIFLCQ